MGLYERFKNLVALGLRYRKAEVTGNESIPGVRDEFDTNLRSAVEFLESVKRPQEENSEVPANFKENAQGAHVPVSRIKPLDLIRDELVNKIIREALEINQLIRNLKENSLDEIATFLELSAAEHNVVMGGKKGNVQLTSFNGKHKILRAKHDYMTFDERLLVAKQLISECLEDWSGRPGVPRGLVVIAERAFRRNAAGEISVSRVLDLRSHDIDDERWKKAMKIITDSIQVMSTVTYLRLYERVGNTDEYKQISLDIASV